MPTKSDLLTKYGLSSHDDDSKPRDGAQTSHDAGRGLYIVGRNIDAKRAWWHCNQGSLQRVSEGIYVQTDLTIEQQRKLLHDHAIRIALFIKPDAVLCGSTAYHRGVVNDTFAMATEFGARVRHLNPGFDVISMRTPWIHEAGAAAFQTITVSDSMGEFPVKCFSSEMLLLESFTNNRTRPDSTKLNPRGMSDLCEAILAKHGDVETALERIDKLANRIGFHAQFKRLEDFMRRSAAYTQVKRSVYEYVVLWNQLQVANLRFDGAEWTMSYERSCKLSLTLSRHFAKDHVPSFISSLLPERTLRTRNAIDEGFREFLIADRYASNITIRPVDRAMQKVIIDRMEGSLTQFVTPDLQFTGMPDATLSVAASSDDALNKLGRHRKTPRTSGMQLKIPCHLAGDGTLSVAHDKAFTHIVKVSPQSADMSTLGSIEWFTMSMAACCGIETEKFVVADIGGPSPVFIAERFDVRNGPNDDSMILTEDMWSIMGLTRNDDKYEADLIAVGAIVRENSTDPYTDVRRLFRQVVFSWVAGNSDLHLKNLMMIKHANDEMNGFSSVRLSPAYDLVCTQVYPGDAETAALRIDNQGMYNADLLRSFAKSLKIERAEADEIMASVITSIGNYAAPMLSSLPEVIRNHDLSVEHINKAANIMAGRSMALAKQLTTPTARPRIRMGSSSSARDADFSFSA